MFFENIRERFFKSIKKILIVIFSIKLTKSDYSLPFSQTFLILFLLINRNVWITCTISNNLNIVGKVENRGFA